MRMEMVCARVMSHFPGIRRVKRAICARMGSRVKMARLVVCKIILRIKKSFFFFSDNARAKLKKLYLAYFKNL